MAKKYPIKQRFVDALAAAPIEKTGSGLRLTMGKDVIEAKGNQIFVWDDTYPGLGLRLTGSTISYIYQARVNRKNRRVKLGSHPAMKVEAARKAAKVEAGKMAQGIDTALERKKQEIEGLTLQDAIDLYLGESSNPKHKALGRDLKPRTVQDVKNCMNTYLKDWLKKPIQSIAGLDCRQRHGELKKRSAARSNLTMRYLRAILNHANNELSPDDGAPLLEVNPVSRIGKSGAWAKTRRRKTLINAGDFPAWWHSLDNLSGAYANEARDFFRFMAMTGCRPGEAFTLRWEDVDTEKAIIIFRDTKNHDDHALPTGAWLTEMLRQRRSIAGGSYVFSRADGALPSDPNATKPDFFRSYSRQVVVKFTATDLRRGMATRLETMGYGGFTIKTVLNHRSGRSGADVTAGYVSLDAHLLRDVIQAVEDAILAEVAVIDERVSA